MGNYRVCGCFTRKFKSDALSPPDDVKDLFNKYSESGGQMSVKSLHRFLLEVQGQNDATEKDAEHVIEVLRQRRHVSVFQLHGLNLDGFFHFLFSEDLSPVINSKGPTTLWDVDPEDDAQVDMEGGLDETHIGLVGVPLSMFENASDSNSDGDMVDPDLFIQQLGAEISGA